MQLKEYLSLVVDDKYNVGSVFGKFGNQLSRGDMLFIEYVLGNNPHYKNIIELGTAAGITSLYLGMAMKLRNGKFTSIDIIDHRAEEIKLAWMDNMTHILADLSSCANVKVVDAIYGINTLAFIDNGNKAIEVYDYAPYLNQGSGFIVHDWGTEIFGHQIEETIQKYNFKREYEDIGNMLYCNCAYFVKEKVSITFGGDIPELGFSAEKWNEIYNKK